MTYKEFPNVYSLTSDATLIMMLI